MARTKASVGAKVSSVKSSKARAAAPPPPSPKTERGGGRGRSSLVGGNPVCPRETPAWQLPITRFFQHNNGDIANAPGSSSAAPACPATESDSDGELDTSGALPELHGDNCHKIAEYFTPAPAASHDKENVRRGKRSLQAQQHNSKRAKIAA